MIYKIIDIEGIGPVYAEKNLCNRVPSLKEVEKMIAQAKELPPMMEY